jgi:hypothetical protein
MVEYKTTNATYKLKASALYYIGYSEDIKLNKSFVFTIRLTRSREDQKPVVSLISPGNNGFFDGIFRFRFTDNTDADCSLYLSEEINWWIESAKLENLESGKEYSITTDAEEKDYKWKILCKDEDGNTGESQVFNVKPKAVEDLATSSIVQDVYDVIPDFETYGPDERRIVQFLDLEVVLKDAQRKLEMANRDLFNLRTVTNPDEYETKRQEILKRLETIKDETPLIVRSKNKANFVKYADDAELENLLDEYMGLKGREIKNKKSLLETNKELQKRFMIQSSAYNIEVEYISGRKDEITLVIREIESAGEKDTYVESIPKSIIESAKDIVFVTPVNVLKEDPLFESSLGAGKIVYYVKRSMNLDDLPKITAAIISTEEAGVKSVTGFAILDGLGLNDSNKKVFFIQLIIVFILLGVYIYYSTDRTTIFMGGKKDAARETMAVEPAKHIERRYAEKKYVEKRDIGNDKITYLKELVASINTLADMNLKDAAIKYYELKLLYGTLDESEKSLLYQDVMRLSDEIGSRHIISLVNEAMSHISEGNDEEAHKIYMDIEVEFEKLSDGMKSEVYQRCCDIGMRLKDA